MIRNFLAVLICLLLLGCSEIKNGNIKSKWLNPAHVEQTLINIDGSFYPIDVAFPDRWYVKIGKDCEDGEYRENTIQVPKSTYDSLKEGEWFNKE